MAYGRVYGERSMLYGKGSRERRKDVTFYGAVGRKSNFRMGGAEGGQHVSQAPIKTVGRQPQQRKYEKHSESEEE